MPAAAVLPVSGNFHRLHHTESDDCFYRLLRTDARKALGLILGFLCGLLTDLMLPDLFVGLRAFVYMFIGYFSGYCYHIFYDEDIKMPVLLTAAGDFVYGCLFYITKFLLRGRIDLFYYIRRIILPEMIYTILLTIICYRIFLLLNQKLEKMDKRSVGSFV